MTQPPVADQPDGGEYPATTCPHCHEPADLPHTPCTNTHDPRPNRKPY